MCIVRDLCVSIYLDDHCVLLCPSLSLYIYILMYVVCSVVLWAAGKTGSMADAATIDHTAVYVDVNSKTKESVVTSQPAKSEHGNGQGGAEYDAERAKVSLLCFMGLLRSVTPKERRRVFYVS